MENETTGTYTQKTIEGRSIRQKGPSDQGYALPKREKITVRITEAMGFARDILSPVTIQSSLLLPHAPRMSCGDVCQGTKLEQQ